jgi:hypothetical protein
MFCADLLFGYSKHFEFPCAGASVKACKACGRHVVALESDNAIFRAVLEPLMATDPPVATAPSTITIDDDEEDLEPVIARVKRMKFSK